MKSELSNDQTAGVIFLSIVIFIGLFLFHMTLFFSGNFDAESVTLWKSNSLGINIVAIVVNFFLLRYKIEPEQGGKTFLYTTWWIPLLSVGIMIGLVIIVVIEYAPKVTKPFCTRYMDMMKNIFD